MGRLKLCGWALLLAGCAHVSGTRKIAGAVGATLEALPRCEAGAEVGELTLRPNICTKKFCREACCNQCSWTAVFQTKNAVPVPVGPARVQALLGLSESALDCELAAWSEALAGQSVSVDPPRCVVR